MASIKFLVLFSFIIASCLIHESHSAEKSPAALGARFIWKLATQWIPTKSPCTTTTAKAAAAAPAHSFDDFEPDNEIPHHDEPSTAAPTSTAAPASTVAPSSASAVPTSPVGPPSEAPATEAPAPPPAELNADTTPAE
jgi:hypothetical protein